MPRDDIVFPIPPPDEVRKRLAVVTTEAALLRSQLRVSVRYARDRERLHLLDRQGQEKGEAPRG